DIAVNPGGLHAGIDRLAPVYRIGKGCRVSDVQHIVLGIGLGLVVGDRHSRNSTGDLVVQTRKVEQVLPVVVRVTNHIGLGLIGNRCFLYFQGYFQHHYTAGLIVYNADPYRIVVGGDVGVATGGLDLRAGTSRLGSGLIFIVGHRKAGVIARDLGGGIVQVESRHPGDGAFTTDDPRFRRVHPGQGVHHNIKLSIGSTAVGSCNPEINRLSGGACIVLEGRRIGNGNSRSPVCRSGKIVYGPGGGGRCALVDTDV